MNIEENNYELKTYPPNMYPPNMYPPNMYPPNMYPPNMYHPNMYHPNMYHPNMYHPRINPPNMYPQIQSNEAEHTKPHPSVLETDLQDKQNELYPWTKKPPIPEFLDPSQSIKLSLIKVPVKKDNRCYTCKPRGKVKKHIINTSESGLFYFHHDMHKRPVIIMTPSRHVKTIDELKSEELIDLFKSLKKFAQFWNIDEYQLSFNSGNWQTHEHFHCKIRLSEKIINRLRRDHFCKLKLEDRYHEPIETN
jgi:hypothetical protein